MRIIRVLALLGVVAGVAAFEGTGVAASDGQQTASAAKADAHGMVTIGAQAYKEHCAICHGEQREGILPGFPPLLGVNRKMTDAQIVALIHSGKGRMPSFPKVEGAELTELVHYLAAPMAVSAGTGTTVAAGAGSPGGMVEAGSNLFRQSCAFCHGRDTMGGESGPDLTRSKLVLADVRGNQIGEVVRNGRPNSEKKMPAFNFSDQEIQSLAVFIHSQVAKAVAKPGGRRGVEIADLQTGNVEAGKKYFNGAGTCSTCHSPTGDLAGVATKYEGLQLEMQMLYPRGAKSKGTVTLPSGEKVTGTLAYKDEFTVGLKTADGVYHSWSLNKVGFVEDAPVKKHVELFPKYTDKDIHDLMAYIQTLK